MSSHTQTSLHNTDFARYLSAPIHSNANPIAAEFTARKASAKDSFITCAFLVGYVALYLAIGFAAIAGIEKAWTSLLS